MRRLVLLALLATTVATAQESPFALFRARPSDGPAASYLRLSEAEATYRGTDDWGRYVQLRAQAAAAAGLHAEALRWWDAAGGDAPATLSPPAVPPLGTTAVDAAAWIAARAVSARVVMVNEAHHDAASRLLTLRLLPLLYARGYRYLAAEAFAPDSVLAAQPAYPTPAMGTYLGEPVFGEIVREALRLGYTLVPYEIEDDEYGHGGNGQARRDSVQAAHLAERTVERDPEARVLVHAGFAHVHETATDVWRPMAAFFRERTGIDPLTVDQTRRGEVSEPARESAAYRGALPLLGDAPAVLLGPDQIPLPLGVDAPVDVVVVRPRSVYDGGRPVWMTLGGTRTPRSVALPAACAQTVCAAEARPAGEPDGTPLDRAVADRATEAMLYVPTDRPVDVTVVDARTGAPVAP